MGCTYPTYHKFILFIIFFILLILQKKMIKKIKFVVKKEKCKIQGDNISLKMIL